MDFIRDACLVREYRPAWEHTRSLSARLLVSMDENAVKLHLEYVEPYMVELSKDAKFD